MDGIDLGAVRRDRNEGIGDALLGAGDPGNANIVALRCADDLKLRHGSPP
jgi:hypothetical protein